MFWAILFAYLSMFILGLADNLRGPLFPELLKYFNLNNSQGSFSFALASTAALLGNIGSAFALKKIHLNHLLTWTVALMMAGVTLMGFAPLFSWYLAGCFLFGLGLGATGVTQNLLIAENVQTAHQTKIMSSMHGIYGFSSLLAPLLASRSPHAFSGIYSSDNLLTQWQSGFLIVGALSMVVVLMALAISPKEPFIHAADNATGVSKKSPVTTMLWFAGFFATYVACEILVSTRLALYMRNYFNLSLEASSNYVTYFFIFLLAGRLLFAVKSFKGAVRMQMNICLAGSILFLIMGLYVHPFFLALCGLSMAPFYPLAIVYISEKAGMQKRRFITFAMSIQSVCVILMHLSVGYLTDIFGLLFAFGLGVVLLVMALICLNFHPPVEA